MEKIEDAIISCSKKIGEKIVCGTKEDNFLKQLCEKQKKFEGWFQVELANELSNNSKKLNYNNVYIEHKINNNRFADIAIEINEKELVFIEIKYIIKGKAITQSRNSLCGDIINNSQEGKSYGIAVLICKNDKNWFNHEINRIKETKINSIRLSETNVFSKDCLHIILLKPS